MGNGARAEGKTVRARAREKRNTDDVPILTRN